ncbi:MAG: sodium:solute symporter family protein, partial [Myxococcota bacterium]
SYLDSAIVVAYLLITLAIGVWSGRHVSTMKDFCIGDRKMSTTALVMTMFATFVGGGLTIGLVEKVFHVGLVYVFIFLGLSLSKLLTGWLIQRANFPMKDCISPGDVVAYFYGIPGKIFSGVFIAVISAGYLAVQMKSLSYVLDYFYEIPQHQGVWFGLGVVMFYSCVGGIRAVSTTDVFQFGLMFIALPVICFVGLQIVGGYEELWLRVPAERAYFFPQGKNMWKHISAFFLFAPPFITATAIQRILLARDKQQGALALQVTALLGLPFKLMVGLIGLIALASSLKLSGGAILLHLIQQTSPVGIKGLLIVSLLAVVMSSADSGLHLISVTVAHDVVKPIFPRSLSSKGELFLARVASVFSGVFAVGFALHYQDLLDIALSLKSFWVPIFAIPLTAAILGYYASAQTFLITASTGFLFVASWKTFFVGTSSYMPSVLVSFITFFVARQFDSQAVRQGR